MKLVTCNDGRVGQLVGGQVLELDYELELAVIIGKAGKFFSPVEAEEYIAGYIVFNDITARDIQREEVNGEVRQRSQLVRIASS